uniref:Uncharacterized protein n=1 Tax=Arion vulgaris TaxID=1028688 RepID=A0A0B7ATC5_9EUPU
MPTITNWFESQHPYTQCAQLLSASSKVLQHYLYSRSDYDSPAYLVSVDWESNPTHL